MWKGKKTMRLWTVQPYNVYETIEKEGSYRCKPELSVLLDCSQFFNAYDWISKQMKKRVGNPQKGVEYPVWAWHSVEGKNKRPDMRKRYMKVFEKSVLLEIEIPDTQVLLTDHTNWHIILNDAINYKANYMDDISDEQWDIEVEKEEEYYQSLSYEEKIQYKEKGWEKVIYTQAEALPPYVQATFWELEKTQIKKVWILEP